MIPKDEWVWMPHPGHFICADRCEFHLTTRIGGVLISTIGEYFPPESVRAILAKNRQVALENNAKRYEEIGYNRKYETMVFTCERSTDPAYYCCPYRVSDYSELECLGYNGATEAYLGHLETCNKWAAKQ